MTLDQYEPIKTLLQYAPPEMRQFIDEPVLYILEDDDGEIIEMQGSLESISLDPTTFADRLKTAEQSSSMVNAAHCHRPVYALGDYPWLRRKQFPSSGKSLLP